MSGRLERVAVGNWEAIARWRDDRFDIELLVEQETLLSLGRPSNARANEADEISTNPVFQDCHCRMVDDTTGELLLMGQSEQRVFSAVLRVQEDLFQCDIAEHSSAPARNAGRLVLEPGEQVTMDPHFSGEGEDASTTSMRPFRFRLRRARFALAAWSEARRATMIFDHEAAQNRLIAFNFARPSDSAASAGTARYGFRVTIDVEQREASDSCHTV